MKTKIIALMLIIATLFTCVGCGMSSSRYEPDSELIADTECRFERLNIIEYPYKSREFRYWRDTITDVVYVEYINRNGNGTYGGFTPLLNADGTPILWSKMEITK